jgi:hypothetical protein
LTQLVAGGLIDGIGRSPLPGIGTWLDSSRRTGQTGHVPAKTVPYQEWKAVRFYRWKQRLTLVQFFVFVGLFNLLIFNVLLAVIWWLVPHSWLPHFLFIWPIVGILGPLTEVSRQTWQRRQTQRHRDEEADAGRPLSSAS